MASQRNALSASVKALSECLRVNCENDMTPALEPFVDAARQRSASLVFWSARLMEVDPLKFHGAVAEHLPKHLVRVKAPAKPHTAITKAMARCASGMPAGLQWRRVGKTGDDVVIALVSESFDVEADIGERVSGGDVFAIRVSATGDFMLNAPSTLDDDEQEQVDRLRKRYNKERGMLTQQDLANFMKAVILDDSKGVRVKAGGAIYFIPSPHDDVLEPLSLVMAEADVDIVAMPLYDESVLGQFCEPVKTSLLDEAEALRSDAESRLIKAHADAEAHQQWENAGAKGRAPRATVRGDSLMRRVQEARELKAKAVLFKELLGIAVDDVEQAAEAAEKLARDAMLSLVG